MTEKTERLAEIVIGIARAKRDRKAKKKLLKHASDQERGNIETAIATIDAGIVASKSQRDALIRELMD